MFHQVLHCSTLGSIGVGEVGVVNDLDELLESGFGEIDLSKKVGFCLHDVGLIVVGFHTKNRVKQ